MPLLGRKVVPLVKPLTDLDPNETIYTIKHTQEQFRSKVEYEKRLASYEDAVWTCQCSGHINLTHEDAYRSEQEKYTILRDQFPKYFEKTVLELVHHNTEILDTLVDQAWTKIQQAFAVGETVALKNKAQGKTIRGVVVKVDTSDVVNSPQKNGLPNGNCNSPSSDKENAASNNTETDTTPTKWVHPKLLEYKYNLKLEGDDKTISGIPAQDMQRVNRPPSKDLVKLFIRSHALRHGIHPNSPWAVNENHVKMYGLKSKYADFLVSPQKMADLTKKAVSGDKRKRQSGSKDIAPSAKRPKLNSKSPKQTQLTLKSPPDGTVKKRGRPPKSANGTPVSSPKKPQTPKKTPQKSPQKGTQKTPTKRTPSKSKSADTEDSNSSDSSAESDSSDSSEDVALADLKNGKKSSSPNKSNASSPRKRSLADLKRDMEENTPLSQLKNTPNTSLNADGTPKKKRGRPPKPKDPNAVTTPKKRGRPKKDPSEKGTPSKSPTKAGAQSPAKRQRMPKKGMKQMTLFDLKGKAKAAAKSPNKSQQKSPRKPQTPVKLPPVVTKLRKAFKIKDKSNKDRYQYSRLLTMAAEKLTKKQQAILPDDIKGVLLDKIAVIEEKKKLKKMTPEQREEYMKKKRRENAKKKAKVEDTYLPDLQPLPMPKLVHSPDGIANELFGDMVMITEFVNCYKGLLLPEDSRVFNPGEAMKSLASGSEKFLYLGQILQVLLQTLLQDGIAQDYKELGMALASISVTPYGTAELVRLCLRDNDEESDSDSDEDSDDDDESKNDEVPAELVEQLETTELWSMPPEEKLAILRGLCLRIMNSYSVQDYMNECQETATEQWRKRIKHGYSKSKLEKIKQNMEEEEQKAEESAEENKAGVTLKDFYGKNSVAAEEPTSDLASVVKRRRVMAARAIEEKRKRDEIERKRRDKDAEEQRKLREIETFERDFTGALNTAKLVLRQTPIGTDRDHNRYWHFLGAAPGIYVEKGWIGGEMEYHVGPKKESWESSDSDSESESETEVTRGRKPRDQTLKLEKTVPHIGQNLWFHYDNLADIQSLMDRLHTQGVRENNLLSNLKKIYPSIESDFKRIAKLKEKGEEAAEPEQVAPNLVEGMRQDLLDIEMRLRNGGLGGVDNFTDWEKNIGKAQTIQEFGALLIETQTYVPGKFLKGFLGPDGMSKPKEKSKKKKDEEENENEEEEEQKDAEEDIHAGVERWKEAITSCVTFSRLHVLLAMLESCVKWERSMENAKCKVCRKKGDEFLLCDDCNQPFHLYCLRPALTSVPEGEWFCPGCLPVSHRKNSRNKDYRRMAEGSDNSEAGAEESDASGDEAEEEREVDLTCAVCGGDEGLISCSSCPSSFHLECHNPSLRRAPRSIWKCQQCVTGTRLRKPKAKRPQRSARNRRAYTYDESSTSSEEEEEEEDDNEEEEDEDEESESNNSRSRRNISNGTSRSRRSSTQKVIVEEDDDEEDEEEESGSESEEEVVPQKSRKSNENPGAKMLQLLKTLMTRICRNRHAWPFVEPVDKEEVPDYYDIVKNPISFRDMKVKIDDGDYEAPQEFVDDIALLFDNGDLYNKRDSVVGQCIEPLEKLFRDIKEKHFPECSYWRDIGKTESETANNHYGSDTEESSEESESS